MNSIEDKIKVDISSIDQARKDIGVPQRFMAECIGVHETTYSKWKVGKESIPSKYRAPLIRTLSSLRHIHAGDKMVAANDNDQKNSNKDKIAEIDSALQMIGKIVGTITDNDIAESGVTMMLQSIRNKLYEL